MVRMFYVHAEHQEQDMCLCCWAFNPQCAARMWKTHYVGWPLPDTVLVYDLIAPAMQGPIPWQALPRYPLTVGDL